MPDKVKCNDFQILKLQESPDSVPHGEMPRHMKLFVDRFLVDKVVPGNRVTVLGIYSIMKSSAQQGKYFVLCMQNVNCHYAHVIFINFVEYVMLTF